MRRTAPDRRIFLALLLLAAAPTPAEPPGLWTGAMQGTVPATLRGAVVLATAAAAKSWIEANHPTLIDVAPAPIRPQVMAPTMPWLPPAHQDLPGSIWLPGAGRAVLEPERGAAFLRVMRSRAAFDHPVLVYCHPNCWASWNAAKFLVLSGYSRVAWFPPGIEGWGAAGFDLQQTIAVTY